MKRQSELGYFAASRVLAQRIRDRQIPPVLRAEPSPPQRREARAQSSFWKLRKAPKRVWLNRTPSRTRLVFDTWDLSPEEDRSKKSIFQP
ncbi:hypothetical protein AOLI_G00191050 [Acnodon oligacanthus]